MKTSSSPTESDLQSHPVVTREEWIKARQDLLAKEKAFTRQKDQLSAERRALPWVKVEEDYLFEGPDGHETFADLFAGRSQLIIQHFMFGPGWEEGCTGCSFGADHIEGALVHLEHHDVSVVVVSRAPLPEIEAYRQRMGWNFKWVSSFSSKFNFDYHVSFTEEDLKRPQNFYNYEMTDVDMDELDGHSVFYKDATGAIFHTYSCYARGGEELINTYNYLDLTPKGRNEPGPHFNLGDWVKRHDRYDPAPAAACSTDCGCH